MIENKKCLIVQPLRLVNVGNNELLAATGHRDFLMGCIFVEGCKIDVYLGGDFKYFLCSSLLGEDSHFD